MWTVMIDGYEKMVDIGDSRAFFFKRNAGENAIMGALSQVSDFKEVISLFRRMQQVGTEPNESTLVSVLTACPRLGAVM